MTEPGEAPAGPAPESVPPPPVDPAPPLPPLYWGSPEIVVAPRPAPGWEYAGFWRRTVAMLIDGVLLTIVSYAILIPMLLGSLSSADITALQGVNSYTLDPVTGRPIPSPELMSAMGHIMSQLFAGLGIVFLVQAAYFVTLWTIRGASVGQLILGVEIRTEGDGRRIGFWRACLRYIGFLISGWALLIGFIWVAFDARKQGWHDKIAGTLVVRQVG
jgi:uncharacterized RDD family membrane protein YckC